jgi:hypothetical protein
MRITLTCNHNRQAQNSGLEKIPYNHSLTQEVSTVLASPRLISSSPHLIKAHALANLTRRSGARMIHTQPIAQISRFCSPLHTSPCPSLSHREVRPSPLFDQPRWPSPSGAPVCHPPDSEAAPICTSICRIRSIRACIRMRNSRTVQTEHTLCWLAQHLKEEVSCSADRNGKRVVIVLSHNGRNQHWM